MAYQVDNPNINKNTEKPKKILGIKSDFNVKEIFNTNTLTNSLYQSRIKHLCLVSPGEIPFDPDRGVGLYQLLFEQTPPEEIRARIQDQIQRYLPQVSIREIDVVANSNYTVTINIEYSIKNQQEINNVNIEIDA